MKRKKMNASPGWARAASACMALFAMDVRVHAIFNAVMGAGKMPVQRRRARVTEVESARRALRFTEGGLEPARASAGKTGLRTAGTSHATAAEPAHNQRNMRLIAIGRPDKREPDKKCHPAMRRVQTHPQAELWLSHGLN